MPSLVLGPEFNGDLPGDVVATMLSPYVDKGVVGEQEINQSMVGVLTRLLTEADRRAGATTSTST